MFTSFFIKWYKKYMAKNAETFLLKYNVAKTMVRLSYEIIYQVKEYQIRLHNKLQGNPLIDTWKNGGYYSLFVPL